MVIGITTNLTWTTLGKKPGLRGEKPATNNLSYGTADMAKFNIEMVKVQPRADHEDPKGLFKNFGASGVSSQRHASATLPRERPGTHSTGGWEPLPLQMTQPSSPPMPIQQ